MAVINYSNQLKRSGSGYLDYNMAPLQNKAALDAIPPKKRFEGLELVVLHDETSSNQRTKYWCDANLNWVKKTYGGAIAIEGDDQEPQI